MKINRLRNRQQKREFLRNFRQAQAATLSTAVGSGVSVESSRTQGTLSSERSQANTQVREFDMFDRLGTIEAGQRNDAAAAQFRSARAGSIASFASRFVSFGGEGNGLIAKKE